MGRNMDIYISFCIVTSFSIYKPRIGRAQLYGPSISFIEFFNEALYSFPQWLCWSYMTSFSM